MTDLAVGSLQGIDEAANLDRANHAHYQLQFETHPDGRRRARMLVFRAQNLSEAIRILPEHGYVDQDATWSSPRPSTTTMPVRRSDRAPPTPTRAECRSS